MPRIHSRTRILVADDHPLFRGGVVMTLAAEADFEVIAACPDAATAIAEAKAQTPDLALLDISMPGGGIAAARAIRAASPATRIAMLTVSEDEDDAMAALQAGASGYILKGVGGDDLVALVRDLAAGGSWVSPTLASRLLQSLRRPTPENPLADLTKREEDILRLVARGLSNRETGRELGIQEKTVKHYMTGILEKLHVRNRVEAAMLARESWNPKK